MCDLWPPERADATAPPPALEATLRALAATRPTSAAGLEGITGIGAKKKDAYGDAVLAVVAAHA